MAFWFVTQCQFRRVWYHLLLVWCSNDMIFSQCFKKSFNKRLVLQQSEKNSLRWLCLENVLQQQVSNTLGLDAVKAVLECGPVGSLVKLILGGGRDVNLIYCSRASHHEYADILKPVDVTYCPRCKFPVDYCDFGRQWDKCEPYALNEYPQYYTCYMNQKKLTESASKAVDAVTTQPDEPIKKSKAHEAALPPITVQCVSRAKHKVATMIYNLDAYGIKLDNAAKVFKKRFACGSSAVKGLPGQCNHVEIQGDFGSEVEAVLRSNFKEVIRRATGVWGKSFFLDPHKYYYSTQT